MRRPTTPSEAYRWHRDAMNGFQPDIHEDQPQPGWYRRTLCKGGPFVPAVIWWHQVIDQTGHLTEPEVLMCEVNLEPADPFDQWTWLAQSPIDRVAFKEMVRLIEWAGSNDPTHPVLNPRRPVTRPVGPLRKETLHA